MARHLPKEGFEINSTKGFWPNPDEEYFYKTQTPPWKVPRRRKFRGRLKYYYDYGDEALKSEMCEEVITQNRFQPLDSNYTRFMNNEDLRTKEEDNFGNLQERSPEQISLINTSVNISLSESNSFNNYMNVDNKCINDINYFMYTKNKNFCSGYFPDFITLNDNSYYQLSNGNNHNFYYLYVKDKKYLKYLSNLNSKYNNKYFKDMNYAYRVSKKHSWDTVISNNNRKVDSLDYLKNKQINTPRNSEKGALEDNQSLIKVYDNYYYSDHPHYHEETQTHNTPRNSEKGALEGNQSLNKVYDTPRNPEKGALESNQSLNKVYDNHYYSDHPYYHEKTQAQSLNNYYNHQFQNKVYDNQYYSDHPYYSEDAQAQSHNNCYDHNYN